MGIRVSVAMAVYNGEKYLHEQLNSILSMLTSADEVVISYDDSNDNSLSIINSFLEKEKRIKLFFHGKAKGYQSNFTNAVSHCKGDYIFFSDQDDVWVNNKIEKMVAAFEDNKKAELVVTDVACVDHNLNFIKIYPHPKKNPFLNFFKFTMWGCGMAIRNSAKNRILPFPEQHKIGHDVFCGIYLGLTSKICILNDVCILHRIHENNVCGKLSAFSVIENRFFLALALIFRLIQNGIANLQKLYH